MGQTGRSREQAAGSVAATDQARAETLAERCLVPAEYHAPDAEADIELTDADRQFLDYVVDAALELYLARRGGGK